MYLPGTGKDGLAIGNTYVISIYGTDKVFTAEGKDLRVREYTGDNSQLWKCIHDARNRLAFTNVGTGKYLGRDVYQHLACYATSQGDWECITLMALLEGGYRLSADINGKICPTLLARDSGGDYMRVVAESNTIVGLHQHGSQIFKRFECVVSGQLFRSSAPNYQDDTSNSDADSTQDMNDAAVQFLLLHKISNVISVNSHELPPAAQRRLADKSISYKHLPVPDYHAPTLYDLEQAQHAFTSHFSSATLVYCGFGHGRTGTVITALQLYGGRDRKRGDYRDNHVETQDQMDVLDQLRKNLGHGN
jgi:protein-tyrosine phosphatase